MTTPTATPALLDYLTEPLTVGDPDVAGPLAVFPLFGPPPRLEYRAFAQAPAGVTITELEGGASVNDLVVTNPTEVAILLFEGEEVLGAQQNRTFDVSVLVAAASKLTVPVSCVEQGRWDGSRHGESFAAAPQAAYPQLRREKSRQVRAAVAAGLEARAEQGAVWHAVAAKSDRLGTTSPTGAMHDIYEHRRDRLDDLRGAIARRDGQVGALVAIGGGFSVLDHVSRPDAFAALHGPLVQGYALDALEASAQPAPSLGEAEEFLAGVLAQRVSERDGIGLGHEARFASSGIAGSALVAGDGVETDELVQLTAFADDGDAGSGAPQPVSRGRIHRPSQRRTR